MLHAERLGRYEILGHLASGGMAQLYLARLSGAHGFARHVVLKTVLPEQIDDPSFASMFFDEAHLHGETVRDVLDHAQLLGYRLPLDFGLTVVAAAAAGLHHAHEQRGLSGRPLGIVHRDVTLTNLIAGYDGAVKLIDFGIAAVAGDRDIRISGGADAIQQSLRAGLVDDFTLAISPVMFGDGARLFAGIGPGVGVELVATVASPRTTHVRYAVPAQGAPAT